MQCNQDITQIEKYCFKGIVSLLEQFSKTRFLQGLESLRFSPTCFARRKAQEISKPGRNCSQAVVILISL